MNLVINEVYNSETHRKIYDLYEFTQEITADYTNVFATYAKEDDAEFAMSISLSYMDKNEVCSDWYLLRVFSLVVLKSYQSLSMWRNRVEKECI